MLVLSCWWGRYLLTLWLGNYFVKVMDVFTRGLMYKILALEKWEGTLSLPCTLSKSRTRWGMFACHLRPTPRGSGPMQTVRHPSHSLGALTPHCSLSCFSLLLGLLLLSKWRQIELFNTKTMLETCWNHY